LLVLPSESTSTGGMSCVRLRRHLSSRVPERVGVAGNDNIAMHHRCITQAPTASRATTRHYRNPLRSSNQDPLREVTGTS